MAESYLIIADTNYGDVFCIDLASTNETDIRIIKWIMNLAKYRQNGIL